MPENTAGQPVQTGDLARAAGQHDLLAGQMFKSGRIQTGTDLFEDFLDPGAHDPDQFCPADGAAVPFPVTGIAAGFDHFAVVHASCDHATVERLDPFRSGGGHL